MDTYFLNFTDTEMPHITCCLQMMGTGKVYLGAFVFEVEILLGQSIMERQL